MSSRHHIDDFMRGRIIGKIEEGRKITDVAREFDIAHSVVSRMWKSFKTTGMCSRRHGGGRVRSTTPAEDRYIVLSAKRNRRTTAQQVANQFLAASGKQISRKTVARRLRGGGIYARRPVVCVPLTRQHRTARLQWCRDHRNWTEQDWACVLFSDESRFSLSSDCRRQLIWRESGTAYRPENIQEKDRYPTCSIMVWAGIMINGRTRLHVVANGTMTGQRYIDEVLLPHDCLDSEGIQRLVWPARSPDLNPIENVWDVLGRQVAGRNYPPTNKNTLIRAHTEEWNELPQQLLDNVVQSMLRGGKKHMTETSDISKAQTSENQLNQPNIIAFDPNNSMQEKEIKGQVEKFLQAGLIKESNSPYSAPVTLAFKRDEGKKTRLCIDFRKLNALCKADSEPLPIMDSLLDKLAQANFFSTLDLASGYWHVPCLVCTDSFTH
ncbi:transposable element Tcb1 transposase [Trichonephila clavipes]|nr:transposable element Tcb1 transposase [Trichonephila clavipes]